QYVQAPPPRFGQCRSHDVHRDPTDLDVHLKTSYAPLGAGDLEVHVAIVILGAHDVGEDPEPLAFLDEAHGDARDWRPQGYAGVHQGHGGAAYGGHGGGAVGLQDVGDNADSIRELFLRRQHRFDRPV